MEYGIKQLENSGANIIWQNILNTQNELEISNSSMASLLTLNTEEFEEARKQEQSLNLIQVSNLASELGLNLIDFVKGKYDISALKKRYVSNDSNYIPEKYLQAAFSASFALENIIKVASYYGKVREIEEKLQINSKNLVKYHDRVSVKSIADACELLKNCFSRDDFLYVGKLNAFKLKDAEFGEVLKKANSPKELYEKLLTVEQFVEKNWHYTIEKLDDEKLIINSFSSEELQDIYRESEYSSEEVTLIRLGFASSLTNYLGLSDARVMLNKSVHSGDSYSQFEINFSNLKPLSSFQ